MLKMFVVLVAVVLMNTASAVDKWASSPRVIFDKEFTDNGTYHTISEKVIDKLNAELVDIKLLPEYSEEDFGITPFVAQALANGETIQQAVFNYGAYLDNQVQDGVIRVTIDPSNHGQSGGSYLYCPSTLLIYDDSCPEEPMHYGKVSLSKRNFDYYGTHPPAFLWNVYGETYEQEDVLMHELGHSIELTHIHGPDVFEDIVFETTYSKDDFMEPLMDPSRNAWAYGLMFTDKTMLYELYGYPKPLNQVQVNLEIDNGGIPRALIVSMMPDLNAPKRVRVECSKRFCPKYEAAKAGKANARPSFDGVANIPLKDGKYRIQVRNMARIPSTSSQVLGENDYDPYLEGNYFVCGSRSKNYLCKDVYKAKVFSIRRSTVIDVSLEIKE